MANTYFWKPDTANDSGNGLSRDTPKKYLSSAWALASAGDTIRLVNGTYTLTANVSTTIVNKNNVTITSESDDSTLAILDGNSSYYWQLAGDFTNTLGSPANPVKVKNLTFKNMAAGAPNFLSSPKSNSGITFSNCIFKDCKFGDGASIGGFNLQGSGTVLTIQDCLFWDLPAGFSPYSLVTGVGATGVMTFTLKGNTFYLTRGVPQFGLVYLNNYAHLMNVIGNIIWNGTPSSFVAAYALSSTVIATILNNCRYQAGLGTIAAYGGNFGSITNTGDITLDPKFVDRSFGDFRLLPSSPCIDAGLLV